jgi:hypothetical protein
MSVKRKLRALERKVADDRKGNIIKLTDDQDRVIWSPRPPREGERVHEIRVGGVDIREI